ncbi:MAG: UDP-N-acetylmuramoyl-L-alanyl-D-glutamate--2,6-diaminopimelate ligase [Bacteroidales bacterium]
MKEIQYLLKYIKSLKTVNLFHASITSICFDSRSVKLGSAFIAVKGTQVDGHNYIQKAIEKGAKLIVCETLPADLKENVCYVCVEDSSVALGELASAFYDRPSTKLNLIGVTGTNGKTTIVTLSYNLMKSLGYESGLISTIENRIGNKIIASTHTTPDPVQLNLLLSQMVDAGCDYVFMEVSSHAAAQNRIAGLCFKGALFTNLSHDHLDYHKTFRDYIGAKKKFFDQLPRTTFSLVNKDDRNANVMLQNTESKKHFYSLKSPSDFKGKLVEQNFNGQDIIFDQYEFHTFLRGEFNIYNLLAIYGCFRLLGFSSMEILKYMSLLKPAEGRFECMSREDQSLAIVDYAHTPDALKNVLETIVEMKEAGQQIITVCGAGGDRDKSKRDKMAFIASELSDKVILTSDNPRTEDPESILDDMEKGVIKTNKILRITNRKEAIRTASMLANSKDIVLVAGKGHEKYQDINGIKHPFDDKEVLQNLGYN